MSREDHAAAPLLSIARRVEVWDRALALIRSTLRAAGLREVSTPVLVQAPAIEAGIQPLRAPPGYLATSPEQAMKRLLCLGSGPIFQISHVFRDGDQSPRHRQEFHLLEWYRTEESADAVLRDVENLFGCCFAAAGHPGPAQWRRIGLLDVIDETLGLSLRGDEDADDLHRQIVALRDGSELLARAPPGPPSAARTLGTWDAFINAFGDHFLAPWLLAQPGVGVHLGDYPAVLCAMAATGTVGWASPSPAGKQLTHRFESFVGGIECANGYRELRDPDEQWRRIMLTNQLRELQGLFPLPLDHSFLAALRNPGMPCCAGVALGLDRALMVACGAQDLRHVSTHLDPAP